MVNKKIKIIFSGLAAICMLEGCAGVSVRSPAYDNATNEIRARNYTGDNDNGSNNTDNIGYNSQGPYQDCDNAIIYEGENFPRCSAVGVVQVRF